MSYTTTADAASAVLAGNEPTVSEFYDAVERDLYLQPGDTLQAFYQEDPDYTRISHEEDSLLEPDKYTVDEDEQAVVVSDEDMIELQEHRNHVEETFDLTKIASPYESYKLRPEQDTSQETLVDEATRGSAGKYAAVPAITGGVLAAPGTVKLVDEVARTAGDEAIFGLGCILALGAAPLVYVGRKLDEWPAEDELQHRTMEEFADTYSEYTITTADGSDKRVF